MQGMRKILGFLVCFVAVAFIPAQLFADQEPIKTVQAESILNGYQCKPGVEINPNFIPWMKKRTVIDAENKCPWDTGRPVVRIIGDWDIVAECVYVDAGLSGYYDIQGSAKATFECVRQ